MVGRATSGTVTPASRDARYASFTPIRRRPGVGGNYSLGGVQHTPAEHDVVDLSAGRGGGIDDTDEVEVIRSVPPMRTSPPPSVLPDVHGLGDTTYEREGYVEYSLTR